MTKITTLENDCTKLAAGSTKSPLLSRDELVRKSSHVSPSINNKPSITFPSINSKPSDFR